MSKLIRIATAAAVIGFMIGDASARTITISGTHTRSEIAGKCDAVGGVKVGTGASKGGFGCENLDKGTSVNCDAKGHCTGWVPN